MGPVLVRPEIAIDPLEEILRRYLLTGDEEALERVVRETRPRLLAAARRVGAPQDAEDAVQSAYLSLVRKRGGPLGAPVFPWLLTAVIRISYRRKALVRREEAIARRLAVPVDPPSPADAAAGGEGVERLRREVDRLPARYRDPVVLHDLHGLTAREVGLLLDLPEATVRTRVRRARAVLRWRLPPGLALAVLSIPWLLKDAAGHGGQGIAAAAIGGSMNAGGVAAVVLLAAGLGALAGAKLSGGSADPADSKEAVDARLKSEVRRVEETAEATAAGLRKERDAAVARAEKAEKAGAEAAKRLEETKASLAAATAAATAASKGEGGKKGETAIARAISVAEYDEVLGKVDWKAIGSNTRQLLPVLRELRESARKGEKLDLAAAGRTQQLNGALVREASKIHDQLPGLGVNGAFTHPSFMANSISATLEDAGKPLSDTQAEALGKTAREFSDRDKARIQAYDDRSLGLQKALDEAALKDQFFDAASALLAQEQRDILWPAATKGLLGWDLFSSGLMLAQVIRPEVVKDRDAYAGRIEHLLATEAGLDKDHRDGLHATVTAWAAELPESWFEKDTETLAGMQPLMSVAQVEDIGRREVLLLQKVLPDGAIAEEGAKKLRESPVIVFPWIKKGN